MDSQKEDILMSYLKILTQREVDVLSLVARGRHNKEIAYALGIAVPTVEQHLKHVFQKLGIGNRTEAAILYWRQEDDPQNNGNPLYTTG
jgi:DNA-binding NarL/FixJ family response regulator